MRLPNTVPSDDILSPLHMQAHNPAYVAAEAYLASQGYPPTERSDGFVERPFGKLGPITVGNVLRASAHGTELTPLDRAFITMSNTVGGYNAGSREYADRIRTLPDDEALAYAQIFTGLHQSVAVLETVFPSPAGVQAVRSARYMIHKAIYGVGLHAQQGRRTESNIYLYGGRPVEVAMKDDEPLEWLGALKQTVDVLGQTVADPAYRTVPALQSKEFSIHRFVRESSGLPPRVKAYIRPYGAQIYDETYEYGRPGKGVEASMGYTAQLSTTEPIAISKKGQCKDTISIRLDRENPDSPDAEQGHISLDIGSILSDPDTLGGKIARLLAYGDQIASYFEESATVLNHGRLHDSLGNAWPFAEMAARMDVAMQARSLCVPELQRIYISRAAVGTAAMALAAS
jgi:hypothetical protein